MADSVVTLLMFGATADLSRRVDQALGDGCGFRMSRIAVAS